MAVISFSVLLRYFVPVLPSPLDCLPTKHYTDCLYTRLSAGHSNPGVPCSCLSPQPVCWGCGSWLFLILAVWYRLLMDFSAHEHHWWSVLNILHRYDGLCKPLLNLPRSGCGKSLLSPSGRLAVPPQPYECDLHSECDGAGTGLDCLCHVGSHVGGQVF